MPFEYLLPDGDITKQWTPLGDHYSFVDDNVAGDPVGNNDGDTTYIEATAFSNGDDVMTLAASGLSSESINSIEVVMVLKASSSAYGAYPLLKLSGNETVGTLFQPNTSYATNSQSLARPGGGSWAVADLADLQIGVRSGTLGKGAWVRCTQIYLKIDYGTSTPPAPTTPYCDGQTNPTMASEYPAFTAVNAGSANATKAEIEVSKNDDMSSPVWQPGMKTLTTACTPSSRCETVKYDWDASAPYLERLPDPDEKYYWRIRFEISSANSEWSEIQEMSGFVRQWHEPDMACRLLLSFDPSHTGFTDTQSLKFNYKTGLREIIARNGVINEAVQASGGFQVESRAGKTHVVYLSKGRDHSTQGQSVVSKDRATGEWGIPFEVDEGKSFYDTHYFPTNCINNNNYLFCALGDHDVSKIGLKRTRLPNESGSLPGDTQTNTWIDPTTGAPGEKQFINGTYPILFSIPRTGRVYLVFRSGDYRWLFYYSDDDGETWNGPYYYVWHDGTGGSPGKTYFYGFRFDPIRERLHIAGTFNDSGNESKGIWYAYCDLDDSESEGFHDWYNQNNSHLATTSTNSNATTLINPDTDFLILASDVGEGNEYFIQELLIDIDGEPLIFFDHKFKQAGHETEECSVVCARWNKTAGAGFLFTYMTEMVDLKCRVRRSSCPGQSENNGTIKLYISVNAKHYKHGFPDAIGYYDDCSLTGAATKYEALDDGIDRLDNGDYIYVTAGTQKQTFLSNSFSLPDNWNADNSLSDYRILAVKVEVVAWRDVSGSVNPMLRLNSTDYLSGAQTISSAKGKYEYTWGENPDTSAPWTKTEAEDAEFGVEIIAASSNSYVSRIVKKVLINRSTSDAQMACEIYEFVSTDFGETWTARETSRNSGIGVPMLSKGHYNLNNEIEIVWTSGEDIFYLVKSNYGLIQTSANDLRLYWGDTEIDRILDYANVLLSEIIFKSQESVSAGKAHGSKDLYLYFGNPDNSTQPKGEPANTFEAQFNFEDFNVGDGSTELTAAGWTINAGTHYIYSSPPEHSNKIYAGEKSLYGGSNGNIERTIGSGLTNKLIEFAFWVETFTTQSTLLRLVDSSGNIFGAGLTYISNRPGYQTGSTASPTWNEDTSRYTAGKNFWRFAIQVSPEGCYVFVDDELLLGPIAGITEFDKIQMISPTSTYWDYIRISEKHERLTNQTIGQGAITDYSLLKSSTASAPYDSTYDAKHDCGKSHVTKIEVTIRGRDTTPALSDFNAYFAIRISNGDPYDYADLDRELAYSAIPTYGPAMLVTNDGEWTYKTFVFDVDLTSDDSFGVDNTTESFFLNSAGTKAIKIDWGSGDYSATEIEVYEITIHYNEYDPVVVIGSEEWDRGVIGLAAISGIGGDTVTGKAEVGGYRIEAHRNFGIDNSLIIHGNEYMPMDNTGSVSRETNFVIDFLRYVLFGETEPVGFSEYLPISKTINVDFLNSKEFESMLPAEFIQSLILQNLIPMDNLTTGNFESPVPITNGIYKSISRGINIDHNLIRILRKVFNLSNTESLESQKRINIANAEKRLISKRLNLSNTQGLRTGRKFPVSLKGIVQIGHFVPTDNSLRIESNHPVAIETLLNLNIGRPFSVDNAIQSIIGFHNPVSNIAKLEIGKTAIIGHTATILKNVPIPTDYATFARILRGMALSWAFYRAIGNHFPVSWGGGVQFATSRNFSLDWTGGLETRENVPISMSLSLEIEKNTPISNTKMANLEKQVMSDWTSGLESGNKLPLDLIKNLESNFTFPAAFNKYLEFNKPIPASSTSGISQQNKFPTDWLGGILFQTLRLIPLDWTEGKNIPNNILIDNAEFKDYGFLSPIDIVKSLSAYLNTPIGNIAKSEIGKILPSSNVSKLESANQFDIDSVIHLEIGETIPAEIVKYLLQGHKIPLSFSGSTQFTTGRQLSLDWTSSPVIGNRINISSTKQTEIDRKVLTSWVNYFQTSRISPVEFNQRIFKNATGPLSWYSQFEASQNMPMSWKSQIEKASKFGLDWSEHNEFKTGPIPIETLKSLAKEFNVNLDWLGLLFISLCIVNPELTTPELMNVALTSPDLQSAILTTPKINDPELTSPEVTGQGLTTPEVNDSELTGGSGCQN